MASNVTCPRDYIFLMTDDITVNRRMERESYQLFVIAFDAAIRDYFAALPAGAGFDLQAACALLPEHRKLVEVQLLPEGVSAELVNGVGRRLESLPCPKVQKGPVSFFVRKSIWGGAQPMPGEFTFPFQILLSPVAAKRGTSAPLDDLLMETAGLCPPNAAELASGNSGTWWSRLRRVLLGRGGYANTQ